MGRRKAKVLSVAPEATNADGSGLYQCPSCNEWTEAEEDKEIKCDYCRETFKAVTLKKYRRAARVITLRSLVNID